MMNKRIKKRIIGWSVFYLCFILAGIIATYKSGNRTTQVIAANQSDSSKKTTNVKSESVVSAVDEDESGMIYLQADANGTLKGEDGDTALPVIVKVTYYLDGKEISADDIAGKSGTVKIRFDYENKMEKTVKVDNEDITVKVPFMIMSAVVMPSDVFSNVEVTNGKVMSEDDQNIAVGTAFPGIKESLNLENYEETKDIDLADYIEITAEAKDFELDFTANIIASLGMDEIDTADLNDVDDLVDSMDELGDASSALVEGTGSLLSGMKTYQSALTSYTEGTEQLQSGIGAINAAVTQFSSSDDDSTEVVMAAAKALAADAGGLAEGMKELQTNLSAVQTFAQDVYGYQQVVETVKANVTADVAAAQDAVNGADAKATEQANVQMQDSLNEAINAEKEMINSNIELSEEERVAALTALDSLNVSEIQMSGITGDASTSLSDIQVQLDTIPSLTMPSLSINTDKIQASLIDMQTQLSVLVGFSENMSGLSDGIAQLSTSLEALESGASQLTSYNAQILSGINSLVEGTGTLQDGISTFDQEGIQKIKDLSNDDLLKVVNRVKALKEAEAEYKKENAGADGEAKSYVVETAEIATE